MNIHFKNVHNGDSILIEWLENEQPCVGIIDCALSQNGTNPIVEYLSKMEISSIRFAVSSHPHTDHYFGFFELFNYCEERNIKIDMFFHTSGFGGKTFHEFIKKHNRNDKESLKKIFLSPVNSEQSKEDLFNFFKILHDQSIKKSFINEVRAVVTDHMIIKVSENTFLKFFAPVWEIELQDYLTKVLEPNESNILGSKNNNPIANHLSTFIEFSNNGNSILFLSDIEKSTLSRVVADQKFHYDNVKVCQVPHHGSIYNFHHDSWEKITDKNKNISYIISAGDRYKHPEYDVVSYFANKKNTVGIYCTNYVNGYKDFFESQPSREPASEVYFSNIDFIATSDPKHERKGDIIINFKDPDKYTISQNEKLFLIK
jgi:beta-lactamase superfamily II metal-dependent hydrolase